MGQPNSLHIANTGGRLGKLSMLDYDMADPLFTKRDKPPPEAYSSLLIEI